MNTTATAKQVSYIESLRNQLAASTGLRTPHPVSNAVELAEYIAANIGHDAGAECNAPKNRQWLPKLWIAYRNTDAAADLVTADDLPRVWTRFAQHLLWVLTVDAETLTTTEASSLIDALKGN